MMSTKNTDKTKNSGKEHPKGIVTIQTLAMPADTNVYGDIFGGWLVSQMDLAGGLLAKHTSRGRAVTIAIESMEFRHPVHVGDVVSCYVTLIKRGKTSMTVAIEVWSNPHEPQKMLKVTKGTFIYVAIDDEGKPRFLPPEETLHS